MQRRFPPPRATLGTLAAATLLLLAFPIDAGPADYPPLPGRVGDFALKVEPGIALPLALPQSQVFKVGGGETIKALWLLNATMDIGPSATFLTFPTEDSGGGSGTAWGIGASTRFRPMNNSPEHFLAISPWVDLDMLYVRSGNLNRVGFAAATGVLVPVGQARVLWVSPFLRYFQIIQKQRQGMDDSDAKALCLGLTLEVGLGVEHRRPADLTARLDSLDERGTCASNRDINGLPDGLDRCPDVPGPIDK